jgi:hypothetical protein
VIFFLATALVFLLSLATGSGDWPCIEHFLVDITVRIMSCFTFVGLLWWWPLKRKKSRALLFFSAIYLISSLSLGIDRIKQIDQLAKTSLELDTINKTTPGDPDILAQLENKTYTAEELGECAPILNYFQKTSLFLENIAKERLDAWEGIVEETLSPINLCYSSEIISSRKRLEILYAQLTSIDRRSFNYYENALRIFKNQKYKNLNLKETLQKIFEQTTSIHLQFFADIYKNHVELIIAIDNLLHFMLSTGPTCKYEDTTLVFESEEESEQYNALFQEIVRTSNEEEVIRNNFNQEMQKLEARLHP